MFENISFLDSDTSSFSAEDDIIKILKENKIKHVEEKDGLYIYKIFEPVNATLYQIISNKITGLETAPRGNIVYYWKFQYSMKQGRKGKAITIYIKKKGMK